MFRIVRRHDPVGGRGVGPNVRPCEHPHFVLDEKFSTVTCEKCGERLQPFDILLQHAEYWERMLRDRDAAYEAHERLLVEQMRRLIALKSVSAEERSALEAAVRRAAGWSNDDSPRTRQREFQDLVSRIRNNSRLRRQGLVQAADGSWARPTPAVMR